MSEDNPIVACARAWIGTRFHHQGRVKKTNLHAGGVDCLGLLVGVAKELKLKSKDNIELFSLDSTDYSHYPDTQYLRKVLEEELTAIPLNSLTGGDIVLINIDSNPQHLGVISNCDLGLGLIHAYAPARAVVEHTLDNFWYSRIEAVFRISL